ncbi:MAG: ATP-binding protein [Deltaproteobacteria bacterium]|nr:ATP-binding protein [Deltaproteobacteria bacterium]
MRIRNEAKILILVAAVFTGLFYLETQLPFFKKFLPVEENKLVLILLNINLLLILLLIFLITRTFLKAYIEKKRGIWGSGLKLKLITTLLFISIIPSFTLFVIASGFFQVSMDKWFSQKLEEAIDSAYEVYEIHQKNIFDRQERTAKYLKTIIENKTLLEKTEKIDSFLRQERTAASIDYYLIMDGSGNKISGNFAEDIEKNLRKRIDDLKEKAKNSYRLVIPDGQGEYFVSLFPLYDSSENLKAYLFLGAYSEIKTSDRFKELSRFQREFKKSRAYKKLVKYSFYIPLSLVTIVAIFFSTWVGMKLATAITVPIERVREGASIIAKGKFDISLEDKAKDEIGTLVSAFNAMAKQLKIAKDEIEEKRRYMEIILDNVATGILTTDRTGNILLINRAAKSILRIEGEEWKNRSIKELLGKDLRTYMRLFLKDIKTAKEKTVTKDLKINRDNKLIYIRASMTAIFTDSNELEGFIIAIDDITHILQAERLSLWQEVAKKLTHEIKNPLTPIVLSAERLRRKFLTVLSGKEKEILDETTKSIINSAEVIKGIVNDLTKLTPYPQAKKEEDINAIVDEVVQLYQNVIPNVSIKLIKGEVPKILCDKEGIRRALLNLISNSIRAIENGEGLIEIRTGMEKDTNSLYVEIADNGKGIPDKDKPRIFDPYFTTEKEGTGLGLAIVNSIVLEHNGSIEVKDNLPKGTKFIIKFPCIGT